MGVSAVVCMIMAVWATALLGTSDAMSMDQVRQAGKLMRNMCQPKTGVSAATAEAASSGQFAADDRKLKCYMKCVMGMMQSVKNGKYNADVAIAMATKMLPEGIGERSAAAIDKCRVEWDKYDDACDASYAVTECIYKADPEVFYFP